jgi:hypothetical protein
MFRCFAEKARGQYKVKEKHKASQRITYLCDHARAPEKGQGEGQIRFDLEPSIKVGCTARMTVHELDDRTVRVKVDGSHRNYGKYLSYEKQAVKRVSYDAMHRSP